MRQYLDIHNANPQPLVWAKFADDILASIESVDYKKPFIRLTISCQACAKIIPQQHYRHPTLPGHLSVPHPKKDLGVGLVAKLLRQAGVK